MYNQQKSSSQLAIMCRIIQFQQRQSTLLTSRVVVGKDRLQTVGFRTQVCCSSQKTAFCGRSTGNACQSRVRVTCSDTFGTPIRSIRQTKGYVELHHNNEWKPSELNFCTNFR